VQFRRRVFKNFLLIRRFVNKHGGIINMKAISQSCLATAMRAITPRDVCLSLGPAASVVTLTSVMEGM
jgi:hypothetical protein